MSECFMLANVCGDLNIGIILPETPVRGGVIWITFVLCVSHCPHILRHWAIFSPPSWLLMVSWTWSSVFPFGITLFGISTSRLTNSYCTATMFTHWFPLVLISYLYQRFSKIWHNLYFWTTHEGRIVLPFPCWDFDGHVWENTWFQVVYHLLFLPCFMAQRSNEAL